MNKWDTLMWDPLYSVQSSHLKVPGTVLIATNKMQVETNKPGDQNMNV